MALTPKKVYAILKKYTDNSIAGGGAIKGKNCVISSIDPITGGNRVTFQWTLDNGTVQTGTLDVMDGADGQDGQDGAPGQDGADGLGIKSVEVNSNNHLLITYSDDSTEDAGTITTVKGEDGFSPTVVVKESTAERYVLTITDATHSYDTPNLKGSGGGGGASEMSDLTDVSLSNTQTGDILVLDKTDPSNPLWKNSTVLSNKVDKETGKSLSTNDYTNEDKTKVTNAITNTVNNLTNYYLKTETYTQTQINNLIGSISTISFELVSVLPTTDIKTNVIYLVPNTGAGTNIKDEYINLDGTTTGWELIGNTEIDLSDYVTISDLNTTLLGYVQKSQTTGLLKNDGSVDTNTYLTANDIAGKQDTITISGKKVLV